MFNLSYLAQGVKEVLTPSRNWRELKSLRGRELLLMAVMFLAQIFAFAFGGDYSVVGYIGFIVGLATITSLILVDRGLLTNYLWGFIGSILWLVVAVHNHLIGDITSQIYYVIMQFVGVYVWSKSMNKTQSKHVEGKNLTTMGAVSLTVGTLIAYGLSVWLAKSLNGNLVWLDATLLPLGVIGQALMTYGYKSQWIIWILLDVINVIIWSLRVEAGGAGSVSMLVLQIMMTINAVYGAYVWYREN